MVATSRVLNEGVDIPAANVGNCPVGDRQRMREHATTRMVTA